MSDRDSSSGTSPPHEIIIVPPPGHPERQMLLDQCISVRIDVFIHEQHFPLEVEVDEHDPTSIHFLLRLVPSLTPIGTIRTYEVEGGNYYKLSRLAVLKQYRQYRFGRDLVLALHQWAKNDAKRTGAMVVCHSQLPVKGFYAKYVKSAPLMLIQLIPPSLSRYDYQPAVIFPLGSY
ncbi:acyl-CoA N-acyltransferase [Chiua virens]|nr:acyl-CoA N-acyltransferase [Chiua virens]